MSQLLLNTSEGFGTVFAFVVLSENQCLFTWQLDYSHGNSGSDDSIKQITGMHLHNRCETHVELFED